MKNTIRNLGLGTLWCCAGAAWAQQTTPANAPQEATPASPAPASTPASAPPASPAPASAAPPTNPPKATAQSEAGEPRANTSVPRANTSEPHSGAGERAPSAARTVPVGQKSSNATDKLQLGTATVTGDREQPKVMYVVPWKKSDIGDLEGKPMNSLVDEILSPIDRDVFKREVSYYQTVKSGASQNGAPPAGGQGEK